jgi:hypothetical protein
MKNLTEQIGAFIGCSVAALMGVFWLLLLFAGIKWLLGFLF